MKIITSRENPVYRKALKLKRKKYRDETGLYLLEGVKPLEDAFDTGVRVGTVFVREGSRQAERFCLRDTRIIELSRELFDGLSGTETSQGVIAVAAAKVYDAGGFMRETAGRNILIMDRLQDPGNMGTIIRTAEAAGYGGMVLLNGCVDIYSQKVVRAAAGSLLRVPMIKIADAGSAIAFAKEAGKRIAVTCLDGGEDCFAADLSDEIALVIGNEGNGVSDEFIDAADVKVHIPMDGSIESLNAAVAAGILMYLSRKR